MQLEDDDPTVGDIREDIDQIVELLAATAKGVQSGSVRA